MRGKGTSMGHSRPQPGACSGRKTLRRCRKEESEDVVLIDVDADSFRNVILIDIPESLTKKIQGSDSSVPRKDKRCPLRTVIYIDDDENTEDDHHNGKGVNGDGNFTGASSSTGCPTSNHYQNSVDGAGNENISPVKLSKCKRTYSGKASTTNRFGLSTDSESDSSDNDAPDCEFMEGSFEQWEKAFLKRKNDVRNGKSRFCADTRQDIGAGKETDKQAEASVSPTSSKAGYENKDSFEDFKEQREKSSLKRKQDVCSGHSGREDQASTSEFCNDIHQGVGVVNDAERQSKASTSFSSRKGYQFHRSEADVRARGQSFTEDPCCNETFEHGDSSFHKGEQHSPQGPTVSTINKQGTKHVNDAEIFFQDKQKSPQRGPGLSNEEASFRNTQPSGETQDGHGVAFSNEKVGPAPRESSFCECPSLGKSELCVEKDCLQELEESAPEEPSFCNISVNEAQLKQGSSCLVEENEVSAKSLSDGQWKTDCEDNLLHAQDANDDTIQDSLINEREKLKETDEYKRAIEEEWAARQRELQIQAEEAQHLRRLRKRRKAETIRLLDMEKRQKQRVEEIRETQKKDEENMNLKERLRAEVRKELHKLEVMCSDMASLLRGLGIVVDGGLHPLSQEVRVAYKRALLNFHPDRASQSDIRQQVEAEEKFKLISRMKDKFLSTS
ncbi:hypothetical protein LguiB_016011 [Lonicera macranthoides]